MLITQSYAATHDGIDLAAISTILDTNSLNILIHVHLTLDGIDIVDAIATEQVCKSN